MYEKLKYTLRFSNVYSHGQKYWHSCNSVRKRNPSFRKLLQLQMFVVLPFVRMADGWIPKDPLYVELVLGKRPRGRPQLRYKEICKQDMKALGMDLNRWETLISECSVWRQTVQHGLSQFEVTLVQQSEAKRQSRKQQDQGAGQGTDWICLQCGRDDHS